MRRTIKQYNKKDFLFLKEILELEPIEFIGLTKIMGVLPEISQTMDDREKEEKDFTFEELLVPVLDKFHGLSKKKKKELYAVLKEVSLQNEIEAKTKEKS